MSWLSRAWGAVERYGQRATGLGPGTSETGTRCSCGLLDVTPMTVAQVREHWEQRHKDRSVMKIKIMMKTP